MSSFFSSFSSQDLFTAGTLQVLLAGYASLQDRSFHKVEQSTAVNMHFQTLSQELFAAAKEADRDVWEQRNTQLNNLMLSSSLILGLTVAMITEGSFSDDGSGSIEAWLPVTDLFVAAAGLATMLQLMCLATCLHTTSCLSSDALKRAENLSNHINHLLHDDSDAPSAAMTKIYRNEDPPARRRAACGWKDITSEVQSPSRVAPSQNNPKNAFSADDGKKWADGYFCVGTAFSAVALSLLVFDEFKTTRQGLIFSFFNSIGVLHLLWKFCDMSKYPSTPADESTQTSRTSQWTQTEPAEDE